MISKINFLDRNTWEVVPLGNNCSISHYLRSFGIRRFALPFDWNVTCIEAVINLIQNDFLEFLDLNDLLFLAPTRRLLFDENQNNLRVSNEFITPVISKKYRILFPHDFSVNFKGDYQSILTKYRGKIGNFYDVLNSNSHILFVYDNKPLNEWQESQFNSVGISIFFDKNRNWKSPLNDVIKDKFPLLKFSLLDYDEFCSLNLNCT